jgi:hypothetical protein
MMSAGSSKIRLLLIVAAACGGLSSVSFAQTPGGAPASGLPLAFAKLSDASIAQFKANPHALLTAFASAGLPLTTQVRSLILTDPTLIDSLIDVAKGGNDAHKAAIGAGLGQGAKIYSRSAPQTATTIQQRVALSGILQLITAYISASNGIETAAIGGGGGGEGGGGGGTGATGGANAGGAGGGGNGGANPNAGSFSTPDAFTGNGAAGPAGFANDATTGGGATINLLSISQTQN